MRSLRTAAVMAHALTAPANAKAAGAAPTVKSCSTVDPMALATRDNANATAAGQAKSAPLNWNAFMGAVLTACAFATATATLDQPVMSHVTATAP